MFKKILLCSDGSDHALRAAAIAAALARQFDAGLTVLHVLELPVFPAYLEGALDTGLASYLETQRNVQEEAARRTAKVLDDAGIGYTTRHESGHPTEVIVRVAEAERFDLIVLGSRGLSAWKSFLLGSVSDGVVHHAPCTVLIAR